MRIVFLSFMHGFGGAEKQNIALANQLFERGHEVTIVSVAVNNACYDINTGIDYYYLPDRYKGPLKVVGRYLSILQLLEDLKPDIIINFWFQTAYLTALMPKSITRKILYAERGDPSDEEYSGILGWIRKMVTPRIDAFVFQSMGAKDVFGTKIDHKSVVIYNPVDIKQELLYEIKDNQRRKTIVTIGRLHSQKNHELLIKSFNDICEQIPNYTLEIYGDGELFDDLQQLIVSLELQDRVLLKGTDKNVLTKIKDSELFVLSSDYEGLPNVLIEAMCLGIPCISTDCSPGGAREIINHGENGFIVPKNNIKELSKAMLTLLQDKELSSTFSKKAVHIKDKFEPNSIMDKWETFLQWVSK